LSDFLIVLNRYTIIMIHRVFICLLILSGSLFANDRAVNYVGAMLHSLDAIQTIQCDVTNRVIDSGKRSTQNYHLIADQKYALTTFKVPTKITVVKNKKGFFVVTKGDAQKQPKGKPFPVDLPHRFLSNLNLKDITENYSFIVSSENADTVVINIVPIDASPVGNDDQVTLLRLSINKSRALLERVDIFKNNSFKSNDFVRFEYALIGTISVLKHSYSYSRRTDSNPPKVYINENTYSQIILNQKLSDDDFDVL